MWHDVQGLTRLGLRLPSLFQHSPSNQYEAEFVGKMLDLRGRECLCECVGYHVVRGAINEAKGSVFDDPTNKMETDVDMFGARVILMVFREGDCGLVVRKQSGGLESGVEELGKEGTKPEGFLGCVSGGHILTLRGGEGNDFLTFSRPRNGAAVK